MNFCSLSLLFATVAILAVTAVRAPPKWHQLSAEYSYDAYLDDFGKRETREAEGAFGFARRKARFTSQLQSVLQHNSQPGATYKQGVNQFTDWFAEEVANTMIPSAAADDTSFPLAPPEESIRRIPATLKAPAAGKQQQPSPSRVEWDWRRVTTPSPVVTTVKDQGACGSCWAHGTIEAIESQVAISTGRSFVLSQQQLVSCVPNITSHINPNNASEIQVFGACRGYLPSLAIDYVKGPPFHGAIAQEWQNPYRSYWNQMPAGSTFPHTKTPSCGSWMHHFPRPYANVSGYNFVTANDDSAMEAALANVGPVAILMAVYPEFMHYEGGVFSTGACEGKNGSMPASHIVNLVGFGHDAASGEDYWILRNSWSAQWGDGGYAKMKRVKGNEPCGEMLFPIDWKNASSPWVNQKACGECGILMYALVPTLA